MKDGQISGYVDTKYMTVLRIKLIWHNIKDQKIPDTFDLKQVNFLVTLVNYVNQDTQI